jgi:sugar O-acyltransferase (sialic acid O-acetyltransferase NeuD family)
MKKKIAILGSGGFAGEALAILDHEQYEPVGLIGPAPSESSVPLDIIGGDDLIPHLKTRGIAEAVFIAVSHVTRRAELFSLVESAGLELPVLIHPSATILSTRPIGAGTIIYPQVTIMNNCTIGKGVLLNSGCTIGHDCVIGNFCNVGPGANIAGRTHMAEQAFMGIGSCCRENLKIGKGSMIGAGAVVIDDVPDGITVMGVPARPRQNNS